MRNIPPKDVPIIAKKIDSIISKHIIPPDKELLERSSNQLHQSIDEWIQDILKRSQLYPNILALAFIYIQRFTNMHPNIPIYYGGGHRLSFTALMVASKYHCDRSYTNKVWGKIGYHIFSLKEINEMEKDFIKFMDFNFFVSLDEWYSMKYDAENDSLEQESDNYNKDSLNLLPINFNLCVIDKISDKKKCTKEMVKNARKRWKKKHPNKFSSANELYEANRSRWIKRGRQNLIKRSQELEIARLEAELLHLIKNLQ